MSYINAIERPYVQSRKYGNPLDVICEIVITHKFDVPVHDTTYHISISKSFLFNEFKYNICEYEWLVIFFIFYILLFYSIVLPALEIDRFLAQCIRIELVYALQFYS